MILSTTSPSPRRPSRFIESLPSTNHILQASPEELPQTPTNELFYSILSEMDEFETRKQQQQRIRNRGTSQSSTDSLPSSTTSSSASSPGSPTSSARMVDRSHTVKEGNRRSINFTRRSLDKELSLAGEEGQRRRSGSGSGTEEESGGDHKLAKKFVGRLRALTGGRRPS